MRTNKKFHTDKLCGSKKHWLLYNLKLQKHKNHRKIGIQKIFVKNICKARSNWTLTACSEAPIYLFSSSGPFTDINRKEQAAAAAPTICVLPQPGGPYKRTFDRNLKGACEKVFGNFEGNSIIWQW